MSAICLFEEVLARTESASSEYSTMSQCLSALLGRPGRVKFTLILIWTSLETPAVCFLSCRTSCSLAVWSRKVHIYLVTVVSIDIFSKSGCLFLLNFLEKSVHGI